MRFEISQSLYPDGKIRFIARDKDGVVRLRNDTEEGLIEAIKKYNENLATQALEKAKAKTKDKGKGARVKGKDEEQEAAEETPEEIETQTSEQPQPLQEDEDGGRKFLQSELKEQIEEKKKKSGKKSFWDKLR